MKYILLIFISLSSFLACHTSKKAATSTSSPMKNNVTTPKWEILAQGANGGIAEQKYLVIKSESSFKTLWDDTYSRQMPVPECPTVDFSDYWILACYRGVGNSTCHGMKIEDIQSDGKNLNVNILRVSPGKTCICGDMMTYPFVFVKIARFSEKENFVVKEYVRECN